MRRTLSVRLSVPATLLALLFAVPRAEATCGSTACFLATRTQDGSLAKGGFRIDLSYRYVDQSRKREGGSSTDEVLTPGVNFAEGTLELNHHQEILTHYQLVQADASYGLTGRLSLIASIPLLAAKHHEHIVIEDGEEHFSDGDGTTGFGDVSVGARYAFLPSKSSLVLLTGIVKTPTGSYKKLDTEGEITEPTLQPGTGSWDLLGNLGFSQQLHGPGAELFANASYRHNGTNSLEYHLGNEVQAGLGFGRRFGTRWTANLQVNYRHASRDVYLDGDVPSTGSTLVNLTPGVRFEVNYELGLYVFVPVPIYQHVNEAQLTPKIGVVAGFSRRF